MALSQKRIRDKYARVFNKYGKNVDIISRSKTYNDRGYTESSVDTTTTVKGLPMELVITTDQQPFKDMGISDTGLAVPYDTSIERGNHVEYDSETFEVKEIAKHFLPLNVVILVRLARVAD